MPLLLYHFTDVTAFGADHSTIGATVAEAGAVDGHRRSARPDAARKRSSPVPTIICSSGAGVPAVLLMTGHANGGKAHWDAYLGKIYHSPQDDLTQKIDWDARRALRLLNYRIAQAMADAPQRPMWLQGDYFGDLMRPRAARRGRAAKP